jgi:hypothetical protein
MSNTLTALTPTLFSAAQDVSAEPFGAVDAVNVDFDDRGVSVGDDVDVPVAPTRTASDFTPAATSSTGSSAEADTEKVIITKSRKVSWHLTGEQQRRLENGGTNQEWIRQLIAQGMRTLRNEAEGDCAEAIKVGASRAVGTAGVAPFSANINQIVRARKALRDNGAPMADAQLVFDTAAGADLRELNIIQQADQAGSAEERRSGNLLRQFGFQLRESAGIELHTQGTGTGYNTNGALAVGARDVTVEGGSGTILAGDVINFDASSDVHQYVVNTALASNQITIGRPGIRTARADDDAFSLVGDYTPLLAFERSAVVAAMRPPIMPPNPTIEQMLVSDEMGMTYLMLAIAQYGQITWELHLAWGFKVVQGEHVVLLLS